MKIAFIGNEKSVHVVKFVNALSSKGHQVTLFTISGNRDDTAQISADVERNYLPGSSSLAYYTAARRLSSALQSGGFDIVNAHYASGYGTLARYAKASPLVLNACGSDVYDVPYQSKMKYRIVRANLLYADKLLSTSHAMKQQIHSLLGAQHRDVGVVPFGVDLTKFKFHDRSAGDKPEIHIGIVKTLNSIYGIDVLIRAFKLLLAKDNTAPLKLSIYGKGPQLIELMSLTVELGLSDHIHFGGFIDNTAVPDVLADMDIFAAPSIVNESFGVALAEAMASGLPVVATDGDGFKEVVDDGSTGIIVPRGDAEKMAEALKILVDNKNLCLNMGLRGREKVEMQYDLDKNTDALIEVYENTLKPIHA
ncbi:MAG: glycosyltransferase family 4 protein [Clostridiales Family XIII bacterium]|jgi:glycosyltransferase involved in cell wall biosynthesis|nr:glycosyltransferase family 4 protein [Clostridiales Family XIII bacterium]